MLTADILDSLQFLPEAPESSLLYIGNYDALWVAVSVLIAIFASLTTLYVAEQIGQTPGRGVRMAWLGIGALTMGGGIWAMHFIGILAFNLPCAVSYDPAITLASAVPGILASAVAIWVISRPTLLLVHYLGGSMLFGVGIGAMHYSGMAAMRLDGLVRYDPKLFALSILVAVVLAYMALWTRSGLQQRLSGRLALALSAVVMGCAVAGMHYTAMAAAYFISDGYPRDPGASLSPEVLAILVSIFSLMLIGLTLAATFVGRGIKMAGQLRDSEQKVRRILETTQEGFVVVGADNRIVEVNDAICGIMGKTREEVLGYSVYDFIDLNSRPILAEQLQQRGEGKGRTYELELSAGPNRKIPCQVNSTPVFDKQGRIAGSFALITDLSGRRTQEAYMRQAVAVFENTAEGVMITDKGGRLQLVNPAFTEITGYDEAEVVGLSPQFLKSGRHDAAFYKRLWAEVTGSGHWQGEVWNRRKNGQIYPEWLTISTVRDAAGEVQSYVGVFSDISHIKRSEAELERLAHYDPLTDLPNRTLLNVQLSLALERAARSHKKMAVMELDLDGFKTVNDSLGHPSGDLLLQIIGQRLKSALRSEDVIARMGGDEFAIIIETPPSASHLSHIAEKIIQSVSEPADLYGHSALVTASVGIALYPDDGEDVTSLLKAADTAMYAGKQAGRNTFRFHDAGMAEAARVRLRIEQGLRRALENGQLELWYQPQIDFTSRQMIGAEALVRWRDPERGLIGPAEFVPVAEETGLILPLGEWVLLQACMQAHSWQQNGMFIGMISVNVSGPQIERGDFVGTVRQALDSTGIDPLLLELEITESFLLRNAEQALAVVEQLSGLGISVAIDDFGTGYSSLSYLKYLNADKLKIDKRFVRDLPADKDDAAITRAVIALGLSLGFRVVAEGVETEGQEQFLKEEGCHQGQGYLYASPMPAEKFEQWMRARLTPSGRIAIAQTDA
jgi:diguanylate cyclase (GGDEF)-like protein/PAS domain S-box-containing protein